MAVKQQIKKISLLDYANNHNPVLTRRGKKMSFSYLYRLIREDIKGENTRDLWFDYELEGDKDRIWIKIK